MYEVCAATSDDVPPRRAATNARAGSRAPHVVRMLIGLLLAGAGPAIGMRDLTATVGRSQSADGPGGARRIPMRTVHLAEEIEENPLVCCPRRTAPLSPILAGHDLRNRFPRSAFRNPRIAGRGRRIAEWNTAPIPRVY